jgi:hypothetical protein
VASLQNKPKPSNLENQRNVEYDSPGISDEKRENKKGSATRNNNLGSKVTFNIIKMEPQITFNINDKVKTSIFLSCRS